MTIHVDDQRLFLDLGTPMACLWANEKMLALSKAMFIVKVAGNQSDSLVSDEIVPAAVRTSMVAATLAKCAKQTREMAGTLSASASHSQRLPCFPSFSTGQAFPTPCNTDSGSADHAKSDFINIEAARSDCAC